MVGHISLVLLLALLRIVGNRIAISISVKGTDKWVGSILMDNEKFINSILLCNLFFITLAVSPLSNKRYILF